MHILSEKRKFHITDDLLLQGFAAANRNSAIRAQYVINAALGIQTDGKDQSKGGKAQLPDVPAMRVFPEKDKSA